MAQKKSNQSKVGLRQYFRSKSSLKKRPSKEHLNVQNKMIKKSTEKKQVLQSTKASTQSLLDNLQVSSLIEQKEP